MKTFHITVSMTAPDTFTMDTVEEIVSGAMKDSGVDKLLGLKLLTVTDVTDDEAEAREARPIKPVFALTLGDVLASNAKKPKEPVRAYVEDDAQCDLCHGPLKSGVTFSDAAVPPQGVWGWLCQTCANTNGVRYGTGLGQQYDSKTNNKVRG